MTKQVKQQTQTVMNEDYDLANLSIVRLIKIWSLWERYPYGIMGYGPTTKELLTLWAYHRFGRCWIQYKSKRNQS